MIGQVQLVRGRSGLAPTSSKRMNCPRLQAEPEAAVPFIVVDVPPPRQSTLEPVAVPIVHSPAYYLQLEEKNLVTVEEKVELDATERSSEGNPVQWVLSNTDNMLNKMGKNPDSTVETLWRISNSPLGQGTAAGVRNTAKAALKAGQEAAKMAMPVGKWALKESLTVIVNALSEKK